MPGVQSGLPPVPQAVVGTLTRAAIFIVATVNSGGASREAVRSFCGDLPALLRAVGFRDIEGNLSCVMGIGSDAWDRLFGQPRPAELHPFREFKAGSRHAVATPGDLLFHIRAKRMDLCFELATQIMARLGEAVSMPPQATVSFDQSVGAERANEKARVMASDIVQKLQAFAAKKK